MFTFIPASPFGNLNFILVSCYLLFTSPILLSVHFYGGGGCDSIVAIIPPLHLLDSHYTAILFLIPADLRYG